MQGGISNRELEFVLFCIEFVAERLELPVGEIYLKLQQSGLLQDYILANYEILHTQSKDYIVEDIIELMKEKGLL